MTCHNNTMSIWAHDEDQRRFDYVNQMILEDNRRVCHLVINRLDISHDAPEPVEGALLSSHPVEVCHRFPHISLRLFRTLKLWSRTLKPQSMKSISDLEGNAGLK